VVANANSGFVFGRALQITYRTDFFQEDDIWMTSEFTIYNQHCNKKSPVYSIQL
jgi:hypothetical protein